MGITFIPSSAPGMRSTTVSFSRTAASGAGTQNVTGAGFTPRAAIVFAREEGGSDDAASIGFIGQTGDDSVLRQTSTQAWSSATVRLVEVDDGAGNYLRATGAMIADGIALTWEKGASGLDVNGHIIFFR